MATKNLGTGAGLTVTSALLIDYVMAVAVAFIVIFTGMNLRGVRESGKAFAVPTYAFIAGITALAIVSKVHIANNTCALVGFVGDCHTEPQSPGDERAVAAHFGPPLGPPHPRPAPGDVRRGL